MKTRSNRIVILSLVILAAGCKKQDLQKENGAGAGVVTQHAKAWLASQTSATAYQNFLLGQKLIEVPQKILWHETKQFPGTRTSITPVSFTSVVGTLPVNKYLVTETDDAGRVQRGNYYIVLTEKKEQSPSSEVIITPELFNSKTVPENFKGAIIKYDLNNNKVLSKHYEGGVLTGKDDNLVVRKSKNQVPVENIVPIGEGCGYVTIDWYWQTWENGVLIYEEYLYSSTVLYCESGGSGGSGGGSGPTCEEQNEIFVNQGSALSGPIHSVTEFYDGTTWVKDYNWSIYQAGTWGLLSYEKGTLEKKQYPNNQERWEFQSFQHVRIAEAGIVIGGVRTFNDLGAIINITQTRMSVWEQINYSVSSRITCFTNPLTIPYNATKTFYAPNTVVYE